MTESFFEQIQGAISDLIVAVAAVRLNVRSAHNYIVYRAACSELEQKHVEMTGKPRRGWLQEVNGHLSSTLEVSVDDVCTPRPQRMRDIESHYDRLMKLDAELRRFKRKLEEERERLVRDIDLILRT